MPHFCLLPKVVSPTPRSLYLPDPVTPICWWTLSFSPEKVERFLETINSDSANGPDGISPHVLKTCSCTSSLFSVQHLPKVIFHLHGSRPTSLHYINEAQKTFSQMWNQPPQSLQSNCSLQSLKTAVHHRLPTSPSSTMILSFHDPNLPQAHLFPYFQFILLFL